MLVVVHVVGVDACECDAAVLLFLSWGLVFDALLRREWLDGGEKTYKSRRPTMAVAVILYLSFI